jgi:hypothetical protein
MSTRKVSENPPKRKHGVDRIKSKAVDVHGEALRGGNVYGKNAQDLVDEMNRTAAASIEQHRPDEQLFKLKAQPDNGNSLSTFEHAHQRDVARAASLQQRGRNKQA